jgi:hypothetical protein
VLSGIIGLGVQSIDSSDPVSSNFISAVANSCENRIVREVVGITAEVLDPISASSQRVGFCRPLPSGNLPIPIHHLLADNSTYGG